MALHWVLLTCTRHILFYGWTNYSETPSEHATQLPGVVHVKDIFPSLEKASDEIPERARSFLQQALESKHAPDGALMLAASSIDSMLKERGYKSGTLYERIERGWKDGLLTVEMRSWAHEIRLSANEPRHADESYSGASDTDVEQVIQFAKALADYLFVLPARVSKWKQKIEEQSEQAKVA